MGKKCSNLFFNTAWTLFKKSLQFLKAALRNGFPGFLEENQSSSLDVGSLVFCCLS